MHSLVCVTWFAALGVLSRHCYSTRLRLVLYQCLDHTPRAVIRITHSDCTWSIKITWLYRDACEWPVVVELGCWLPHKPHLPSLLHHRGQEGQVREEYTSHRCVQDFHCHRGYLRCANLLQHKCEVLKTCRGTNFHSKSHKYTRSFLNH